MNVIEQPLKTIQDLFDKNWKKGQPSEKDDFGVMKHFQSLFNTREKLQKIPILDAESIKTLPLHSLVRLRCMVQDTELSQEVGLFTSTIISQPDGEEKTVCHRYSSEPQIDHELRDHTQDTIDLLNSYYCVSVPGESQWVKDYERSKKNLERQVQDMTLGSNQPSEVIPERYPFPNVDHFAAVIKTHSSDLSIGVTDVIEVIGVLGASDRLMTDGSFDFHDGNINPPKIATVHAIFMHKVEDHGHPELSLNGYPEEKDLDHFLKEAKSIREELIRYIATAVYGDQLAAELVLLHFLARVHSRLNGTLLGKFSLNLRDSSSNSSIYGNLSKVMRNVLPKVHTIPMSLENLNNNFFFPRGDEYLSSGILQVTRGTALLFDETVMEEGTLVEKGLKNLKAISDISQYQTLNYVFPFNTLEFQTDISLLFLSNGNSLVPVDCAITLKPDPSTSEVLIEPTLEQLNSFRKYISVLRLADYKFSEEMAQEIETDFMEQRKAATAAGTSLTTPNELAFNISLARLVALSQGEQTLTRQSWDHAVSLSRQIESRGKQ
ncbi:putative alanine racemase-domain-containing protein [Lobosporangium transversale]|uniref:Putative alanine racemase-domain-containing protein n=1 Tax=Lobosporangium transversale TaxID=64571 RepID=A0A1Y2GXQ9_9FUNG|nr:putative alanine racemase-domain-containing protein [Lobosporangium transversale]ORZ27067.1 putative alanine racemase-domain-containing protein [Lobosporangium transversale]|eukprot:XP_021884814.1 putative alanine racemase-domain-containing protein [Lobosporangium transversale]